MGLPGDTQRQEAGWGPRQTPWGSRPVPGLRLDWWRGRRLTLPCSPPPSRLASEMQALKQKLATAQSRLKASVAEPLRPGQQGTTGWPGSGVGGCWNRGSGLLLSPLLGGCGGPGWPWVRDVCSGHSVSWVGKPPGLSLPQLGPAHPLPALTHTGLCLGAQGEASWAGGKMGHRPWTLTASLCPQLQLVQPQLTHRPRSS